MSTGSIKMSPILESVSIITPIIVANSKIRLNFHIIMIIDYYKVNTSLGQYECHCGLEFTDSNQLTQHINSTYSGGVWACSFLGCTSPTVYKSASSVREHYRTIHKNIFHYQCKLCQYGHEEETTIKQHLERKHKIAGMALKCTNCGRLFGQKNKFESHILICGNEVRPFICPEPGCPKAYRSKWSFDNHMRTVHPKPDQDPITFTCEYCAKNLDSKQALDTHRKQKHLKKVSKTKIGYDLNWTQYIGSNMDVY